MYKELYTDNKKIKKFTKSPLPFMGQKKNFLKAFVENVVHSIPENSIVVDLFGGSGLLSHTVKYYRPDLKVVCNDYDNFKDRLEIINETNEKLQQLRDVIGICDYIDRVYKKVEDKEHVSFLKSFYGSLDESDDWITLSNQTQAKSTKIGPNRERFYNKVVKNDYCKEGYLSGVYRESLDHAELLKKYIKEDGLFLIVDPPYEKRPNETGTYKGTGFLSLEDCRQLGVDYVYFQSGKARAIGDYVYARQNNIGEQFWTDVMITSLPPSQSLIEGIR